MTDHPRFERMRYRSDEAHRRHHGGVLVDITLGAVALWALPRLTRRALPAFKFEVGVLITLVLLTIILVGAGIAHSRKVLGDPSQKTAPATSVARDASADADTMNTRRPQFPYPYAAYTP